MRINLYIVAFAVNLLDNRKDQLLKKISMKRILLSIQVDKHKSLI